MSRTTAPTLPPRQIKLFLGPFPGMKKFDGQIGDEFHLILEYSLQNVLQIGHDLRPKNSSCYLPVSTGKR